MNRLQLLTFEVTTHCNLSGLHSRCPSGKPCRYELLDTSRPVSEDRIVEIAEESHHLGFRGKIAWHGYCEPLLEFDKIRRLIARIREKVAGQRFLLWTNGALIENVADKLAGLFDTICVSNYLKRDWSFLHSACGDIRVFSGHLDRRMDPQGGDGDGPCRRVNVELLVDFYGNACPCCQDWRGALCLGNVNTDEWGSIVERYRSLRSQLDSFRMLPGAPERCRKCGTRDAGIPDYA